MDISIFDDNFLRTEKRKLRRSLQTLRQKALKDVSTEFYKKLYKMKLVLNKSNKYITKETFTEFVEVSQQFKQLHNYYHQFITISLPPVFKENLGKLQGLMSKLLKWKWIDQWEYTIEQRGITPETLGEGIHIHLINKNPKITKRPSHIVREVSKLFNIKKNFVDVETSNDQELLETRRKYIRGEKKDTKMDAVKMDKLFRKNNNLALVYTNASSS